MRFALGRVFLGFPWYALTGCLALCAQAPPNGVIGGIVLDGERNAPIRRAIVTLSTVEARPQDAVAWTDASGRFAFGYLPPGRYQVRAQKNGYQPAALGAETPFRPPAIITLATGGNRSEIAIRLQPFGVISGIVLDEDGDPVVGAQVSALTPGFQRRRRTLLHRSEAMTDNRGRYRLNTLAPGRYAVVVRHLFRPVFRAQPESTANPSPPAFTYGVQYYSGVDRSASATLLEVQAGKEVEGIDFRLAARPTVALQGRVLLPQGVIPSGQVSVDILDEPDSAQGVSMSTSASAPNFMFRLDNCAPGSYLVVARTLAEGRQYRGVQRVELGADSPEVTIPLERGIDLAGSFTIEGPGARQHPDTYVTLVPGDGIPWRGVPLRATVNKDGTFRVTNVPPGVWDIGPGPIPPGGYLKSMRLGDQDVLAEEMVITSETGAPLRIVVSTQGATVEGSVTNSRRAVVLLAPEGRFRAVTSFYRLTTSDEEGHFEIKGAMPGAYKLYAFEELNANAIEDPEFLKPLESFGAAVVLQEGQSTSQDLTPIPAGARGKQ